MAIEVSSPAFEQGGVIPTHREGPSDGVKSARGDIFPVHVVLKTIALIGMLDGMIAFVPLITVVIWLLAQK